MNYYSELVNADMLSLIIENYDHIAIDWTKTSKKKDLELQKLKVYHKKIVNNQIKVCYKPSPKQPEGRLYVEKGLGLQSMKKEIRQTLTPNYYDYDAKMALPTILIWYAKKNGISTKELETISSDYQLYKKYKEPILKCIFGGAIDEPFLKDLKTEIGNIQTFMVGQFPNKAGVKKENYKGSLCALILQEYEKIALDYCEEFLVINKLPNINMLKMFDGFEVPYKLDEYLEKMNAYVLEKTGIPLIYVNKPKEHIIDMTKFETSENKMKNEYFENKNEFEQNVCMIQEPLHFIVERKNGISRIAKNDLGILYAHLTLGKKRIPFINEWLRDANKKVYENIDFLPPPCVVPPETYNLWKGFPIEKIKLFPYSTDDLEPFFSLVRVMANNDPNAFKYLLDWNADIIQNAGRKTGIAIVIKGAQGIGKNTYASIQKKLFSQDNYVDTADPKKDIFGDYNNLTTNKLLINFNETESKDTFANNSRIKDMITEPTENVREKYLKALVVKSFVRLQFLSNNNIVVKLEDGDRRFVIIEASAEKKGDTIYWEMINSWMNDDFNIRKLFDFLSKRDISKVKWEKERPITEAYTETMDACKCIELKFLDDLLHDWGKETEKKIPNKTIADKIKKDYNLPNEYNMKIFTQTIKKFEIPIQPYKNDTIRGWKIDKQTLLDWMVSKKYHKPEIYEFIESEVEIDA